MKNIYKIFSSIFILFVLIGCAEDFSDNNEFAKNFMLHIRKTTGLDSIISDYSYRNSRKTLSGF